MAVSINLLLIPSASHHVEWERQHYLFSILTITSSI